MRTLPLAIKQQRRFNVFKLVDVVTFFVFKKPIKIENALAYVQYGHGIRRKFGGRFSSTAY